MNISIEPRISKIIMLTVGAIITCCVAPKLIWNSLNSVGLNAIYNVNITDMGHDFYAKNSADALFCYKTALKIAEIAHLDNATKAESNLNLANAYYQIRNYDLAEIYCLRAIRLFESEVKPSQDKIRWTLECLTSISNQTNKADQADRVRLKLTTLKKANPYLP